jgi:MFS family permease
VSAATLRRAAVAVALLFVANGLLVGAFGGSLPGFRDALGLRDGHVVGLLVGAGICAVAAMQVAGRLADRVGARLPSFAGAALMVAATWLLAAAPDYAVLLLGAAVFGLGNGAMDVAMNALGVRVEQARGGPIMSRFHAFFSLGNLAGAGTVVALGRVASWLPVLVAGLLGVVLLLLAWPRAPQTPHENRHAVAGGPIPRIAWLLAAMAVCFGLTEGTGVDWSSLHVTDVAHLSPSAGAWGLACVSGFMVVVRLFGDAAVARLGRRTVVSTGSGFAMAGYLLTALSGALPVILLGWCLVGFGVGLVAPQIYGLAGHAGGGRVLAVVVSFGYAAFLVGPAIIGWLAVHAGSAGHPGIQRAMFLPMVSAVGLVVMSTWLREPRPAAVR